MSGRLIGSHGGFRNLHCFELSEVVYDATIVFCDRFVEKGSRTRDQMIRAARSGRQNIAEGSVDSATSKKIEIKLTSIARGSLVELQLDFEDYLRQHRLTLWSKDDPRCLKICAVALQDGEGSKRYRTDLEYRLYAKYFE